MVMFGMFGVKIRERKGKGMNNLCVKIGRDYFIDRIFETWLLRVQVCITFSLIIPAADMVLHVQFFL